MFYVRDSYPVHLKVTIASVSESVISRFLLGTLTR